MTSSPFPPPDDPSSSNGPPRLPREARITAALIDLADTLVDDFDPAEFLYRVAEHCMDLLDIGDAGVMLAVPGGPLRLVAASSERVRLVELFELDAAEGPAAPLSTRPSPSTTPSPRHLHRAGHASVPAPTAPATPPCTPPRSGCAATPSAC